MWLHRFMKVDDREHYTLPTLDMLEHNLEAAISKVRSEKERKMGGEINFLENMVLLNNIKNHLIAYYFEHVWQSVHFSYILSAPNSQVRDKQEERFGLSEKVRGALTYPAIFNMHVKSTRVAIWSYYRKADWFFGLTHTCKAIAGTNLLSFLFTDTFVYLVIGKYLLFKLFFS